MIALMSLKFDQHIRKFVKGDIIFSFNKELSSSQITDDLLVIDQTLNNSDIDIKMRKRIFYITVEAIQNLYHHKMSDKDAPDDTAKLCWFFISKSGDDYSIVTGNFIKKENVEKIKNHLNKINLQKPDELKLLYTSILTNQQFSSKGGGGLGMIDIARKAEGKYSYEFLPYKNNTVFFELQIPINQK